MPYTIIYKTHAHGSIHEAVVWARNEMSARIAFASVHAGAIVIRVDC